jgi:microcystin-dependent protein
MSDTLTQYLGMTKPAVGASRDTWGSKVNANLDTIDEFLYFATPVGAILDFAGPNAPAGWLICDGRLLSRVTYSALFAVIGTYWGSGDGSTTFALPNTPGRAAVAPGTVIDQNGNQLTYSFGQITGALSAQIAQANLPAVTLTSSTIAAHAHGGATAPGANHTHGMDVQGDHNHSTDVQGSHAHGGVTDNRGSHQHNVTIPASGTGVAPNVQWPVTSPQLGQTNVVTDAQGLHAHNISTDTQGAHGHNISVAGAHAHNNAYSGNLQLGIYADGAHAHSVPLGGSGAWLSLTTPLLVCTKIIYAGSQAGTDLLDLPALQRRRPSAPLRGGVRAIQGR